MMLKAYLSIDDLTEEEIPFFQEIASQYFVEYSLINIRNGRRFYVGIIRSEDLISGFIQTIDSKSPSIIGVFQKSGLQYELEYTTGEETVIEGTLHYSFKEAEFISLMPDNVTYDIDGVETSRERPIVVKDLKGFAGWQDCIF